MAKLLWEWKPRFGVALVARGLLIVTWHTNYDVTSCPVVMRCYANTDGDEHAVPDSSTNHSSADHIVVNTYNNTQAMANP